jgi:hypothetical protein
VLNFHLGEETDYLGNGLEIIFKKLGLKHQGKVLGDILAFVKTALQVVCDFRDIWNIIVLNRLVIVLGELEVHLVSQKEFYEKVHYFCILFAFKIVVREHIHAAAHQKLSSIFMEMNPGNRPVARVS